MNKNVYSMSPGWVGAIFFFAFIYFLFSWAGSFWFLGHAR